MDATTMRKRAQELRKSMTQEERMLWYRYLKDHPVQWNRQKVFGEYIVDFYCKTKKLVIEVDGSQHYEPEQIAYDIRRTEYLNSLDLVVLRFTNTDVKRNLSGVCEQIDRTLQDLPLGGRWPNEVRSDEGPGQYEFAERQEKAESACGDPHQSRLRRASFPRGKLKRPSPKGRF